jgi:hypothetical protein
MNLNWQRAAERATVEAIAALRLAIAAMQNSRRTKPDWMRTVHC